MAKDFDKERERMVKTQLVGRGIKDKRVLEAMRKVARHLFIPENMRSYAYNDEPLPIGEGQTISQPYIVAYMTEALQLNGSERVLEIGTGSGYQTAILNEIVKEVFTLELIGSLSVKAQEVLKELKYVNIFFKIGDGTLGWKEHAPYDAIMVTAAPAGVPKALKEQLKMYGKMIIPIGATFQELVLVIREKKKFKIKKLLPVRFVPLVSAH
ncbi:MAG: protein-L-isoaspartate(D-aspartate) O-methyltransferase [Candidatus Aminicenantes bacterium]|nr:protein-L-isoaspartate(D-aspartate) O-methyltransferase [Candidatus Aminicenantes bacterium]